MKQTDDESYIGYSEEDQHIREPLEKIPIELNAIDNKLQKNPQLPPEHILEYDTKNKMMYYSQNEKEHQYPSSSDTMHDLLLFAVELIDKAKDKQSAVNMVLDRVCQLFEFDGVSYIEYELSGELSRKLIWSMGDNKEDIFEHFIDYRMVDWNEEAIAYSDNDITVVDVKKLHNKALKNTTVKWLVLVFIMEKGYRKSLFAFSDSVHNEKISDAAKNVLKAIAVLLSTNLGRIQAEFLAEQEKERLISYDNVTKLPTYTKFCNLSEQKIRQTGQNYYLIIYSDFGNFHYVNETFGYVVGDIVLKEFGKYMKENFADIIYISRVTSDRFVILTRGDVHSIRDCYIILCRRFCEEMHRSLGIFNLYINSGIASIETSKLYSIAVFVDYANQARKTIKQIAETNCAVFTEEIKRKIDERMEMTATMEEAMEHGEFQVYLQPKINLSNGKLAGAEALARWIKTDGTMIVPDKFIPLFEENGYVVKLDFHILQQVLKEMRKQLDANETVLPISVNFSRKHKENEEFVLNVVELLKEYNIPPKLLEVEMTETVFEGNLSILEEILCMFRKHGIKVSIDDFGSGYSSLNVLANISVNIVKLDRVFLNKNDKNDHTILKYLIEMLKELGITILAEGVETKEQAEMLVDFGCDLAQGYYYAKPMPITEFYEFVKCTYKI